MKGTENLTPFEYDSAFAYSLEGIIMVVLCVSGRFLMPPPGTLQDTPLTILDDQQPPPMADEYWSDPSNSSLRNAGQGVPQRRGAEVYLRGSAWAPFGRPIAKMRTAVRVGPCSKTVDVIGDRYWVRGFADMAASGPEPFVTMPLTYERSFGGTVYGDGGRLLAQEPRNPIGQGLYVHRNDAAHQLLANLEAPGEEIDSWNARGTPSCYGPIPGSWQPRRSLAGTYDQEWVDERMPFWPHDTDPKFFSAAAVGLVSPGQLRPQELVVMEGMSPDGDFAFRLPHCRIVAKSVYENQAIRGMMRLDGVLLEPDQRAVTLYWRRMVPLGHGPGLHLRSIVRLLEPWEEDVVE